MPIKNMSATHLEQECAGCDALRSIAINTLTLGVTTTLGGPSNRDAIKLPTCPECGSVEFLSRTFDQAPAKDANEPYVQHRKLVNALAAHLKDAGRVHLSLLTEVVADTRSSPDLAASLVGAVPKLFAKKLGG